MAEKVIDNKYLMIDVIKSEYPDINEQGIAAIMGNVELESAGGKFGREIPQTYEQIWSKGKNLRSMQGNITDYYNSIGITDKEKQKKAYNKLVKENPESALGVAYMEDPDSSFAGGTGPLQLTIADYGKLKGRAKKFKALMLDSGFEGTFSEYMGKINADPAFGLRETIRFYKKHGSKKNWSVDSLNNTTAQKLGDTVINPGRKWISSKKWKVYQKAGNASIRDYNVNYAPDRFDRGLQEEYEKYANEASGEGVADENILSYEDYYKQIGEVGSPRARKLKRDSLQGLGPRVVKTEEKKEDEVVGKVDEDGNLILTPIPIAPGTTISDEGEVDFGGHIQKRKDELKKKKEKEKKKKEEVYQPKKLVPLESLSDEERAALSNEEREAYGLEPLISDEEKAARDEEERLRFEKEKEEEMLYSQQQDEKRKTKGKGRDKKVETVMVDKDGDGIPDTIDADAGEPTGGPAPENQLTVSTEEQVVIDEQEKESAIETVETEEMEVLDANGNIKKITVPTVKTPTTPTTVETEGVTTSSDVVEEKPELVKPKLKDFKTSSDYVRARMKYFKSVEDQDELDFDNELDDDEIKEVVDMEQNSAVIDASKRNIFKTNGKSNIFNSIIGDIDNLAKGIQQELNNITKSINNRD